LESEKTTEANTILLLEALHHNLIDDHHKDFSFTKEIQNENLA
jgi:hypothetical protein